MSIQTSPSKSAKSAKSPNSQPKAGCKAPTRFSAPSDLRDKYALSDLRAFALARTTATPEITVAAAIAELNDPTHKGPAVFVVHFAFVPQGATIIRVDIDAGGNYTESILPDVIETEGANVVCVLGSSVLLALAVLCGVSVHDFNTHFEATYGICTLKADANVALGTDKKLLRNRAFRIKARTPCIACGKPIADDAVLASKGVFNKQLAAHAACTHAPVSFTAQGAAFTLAMQKRDGKTRLVVDEPAGLTHVVDCNHVLVAEATAAAEAAAAAPAACPADVTGITVLTAKQENVCTPVVVLSESDDESHASTGNETEPESEAPESEAAQTPTTPLVFAKKRPAYAMAAMPEPAPKKPKMHAPAAAPADESDKLGAALGALEAAWPCGTPAPPNLRALMFKLIVEHVK